MAVAQPKDPSSRLLPGDLCHPLPRFVLDLHSPEKLISTSHPADMTVQSERATLLQAKAPMPLPHLRLPTSGGAVLAKIMLAVRWISTVHTNIVIY